MADFFAALGVPRRFGQDPSELERRYYALSRELHPDRFAAAPAAERREKLERMSLVNDAYRTLRDRGALRAHLLALEGAAGGKTPPPADWAERWFDVQDDPAGRIAFAEELGRALADGEAGLDRLESDYDRAPSPEGLKAIAAEAGRLSYLRSLERDVRR